MADHPFAQFLRILGKGPKSRRSLTEPEAEQAMQMVLAGQVSDKQLGAFLLLMRANGETPAELQGFVKAIRKKFVDTNYQEQSCIDLDVAAYAGKWRYPAYFLLMIKLLVKNGYKVLLHGDSGQFESRQYVEQYLDMLDFKQANSLKNAASLVKQSLPVYLPLKCYAPQLRTILHLKEELGVRTVFNTAVKLLNPLNSHYCMQGIYHKGVENLHHQSSYINGSQKNLVFKGEGGEPEIRPDALTHLYFSDHTKNDSFNDILFTSISERTMRKKTWKPDDLLQLWLGKKQDSYGRNAVIATTAVALMLMEESQVKTALEKAKRLWQDRLI